MKKSAYGSKNQFIMFLRIMASFLLCGIYVFSVISLNRVIYRNCFYSHFVLSFIFAMVGCVLLFAMVVFLNRDFILSLVKNIRLLVPIVVAVIIILLSPFFFIKSGVVADNEGIKKNNIFGKTVEVLPYEEITSIDISVRHGVQYEISFSSGKTINISSFEGVHTFLSDEVLVKFDKSISQYSKKKVTQDTVYLEPWNTRRFFRTREGFEYFDDFFSTYYSRP